MKAKKKFLKVKMLYWHLYTSLGGGTTQTPQRRKLKVILVCKKKKKMCNTRMQKNVCVKAQTF